MMTFIGLEKVNKNPRGGDWDQLILQKETKWIYTLKAKKTPGLNENISYAPLLNIYIFFVLISVGLSLLY